MKALVNIEEGQEFNLRALVYNSDEPMVVDNVYEGDSDELAAFIHDDYPEVDFEVAVEDGSWLGN